MGREVASVPAVGTPAMTHPVGFVFQGSSVCQVTAIGVTVILLYTSRACYNLFILSFSQIKNVHSFDYDWYNVSDQVGGT